MFDNTSFLGVEEEDYMIGEVITIEGGQREITIYNGADTGSLTFLLSFSGAHNSLGALALAATAATLINLF